MPKDAGFVALLAFLPELKVFKTEVAGRAILSYARSGFIGRQKTANSQLALEVISEAHPNTQIMECLAKMCPGLRELQVSWHQNLHFDSFHVREAWVPKLEILPEITHLITSNIDHKTDNLRNALPVIGTKLVVLDFQVSSNNHS